MRRSDRNRPIGQLELWTPEPVRTGQEEINLVEWPWAALTDASPKDTRVLTFSDTIRAENGRTLNRTWTVTAPANGALPTAVDECVLLVLQEITKDMGMASDVIPFTRSDLCRRLGWAAGGKEYKRLDDSLRRLAGVQIEANNAFWDKSGRVYRSLVFHIFDELAIGDGRAGGDRPVSHVRWSQVLWASMEARYLKSLDLDFALSLRSPLARRILRYMDRKRHLNREFTIGLHKLAFEHLGVSRGYSTPEIRRLLNRAHVELQERGFLAAVEYGTMADGSPKVTYIFSEPGHRRPEPPALPDPDRPAVVDHQAALLAAERKRLEDLDQLVTPEIQAEAERIVSERKVPRPPKRGTAAWRDMVATEARRLVANGAGVPHSEGGEQTC